MTREGRGVGRKQEKKANVRSHFRRQSEIACLAPVPINKGMMWNAYGGIQPGVL